MGWNDQTNIVLLNLPCEVCVSSHVPEKLCVVSSPEWEINVLKLFGSLALCLGARSSLDVPLPSVAAVIYCYRLTDLEGATIVSNLQWVGRHIDNRDIYNNIYCYIVQVIMFGPGYDT